VLECSAIDKMNDGYMAPSTPRRSLADAINRLSRNRPLSARRTRARTLAFSRSLHPPFALSRRRSCGRNLRHFARWRAREGAIARFNKQVGQDVGLRDRGFNRSCVHIDFFVRCLSRCFHVPRTRIPSRSLLIGMRRAYYTCACPRVC